MSLGLMDILRLLGALGLFLYGMKVMSDALMLLAGNRMRQILAYSTSNRFFALIVGFLITATIQSSSATTLMVVSFVNASLLTLSEAVGVIMGANIGTTVTAWLITILGLKVSMSSIALPILGFGFVLSVSKSSQRSHWGHFLIGFALLFIGLQFLKDSVPDIGQHPETLEFLTQYTQYGYGSVLLFVFIGTVLTLVVQSSSATMAITLLMCSEGWIPFEMAAAMVMGENIGTTITANLAAMVSNFQARRAARAHLIFNLLGVSWMLLLFYPFIGQIGKWVEQSEGVSPFVSAAAIPVALSLFHTSFNIINALILLGFIGLIVKIVTRLVPEVKAVEKQMELPLYLSNEALSYVETGIKALSDESLRLLDNAGYKVMSNALGMHRKDIDSDISIRAFLDRDHKQLGINIDEVYETGIKPIYSSILKYATELQHLTRPEPSQIEAIRNILVADRLLVQTVKLLKPLQENLEHSLKIEHENLHHEYNILRRRILKVVRVLRRLRTHQNPEFFFAKLQVQKRKIEELDLLANGHLDKLLASGAITEEMASSLLEDSATATLISRNLIDIALILCKPADQIIGQIDAENSAVPQDNTLT